MNEIEDMTKEQLLHELQMARSIMEYSDDAIIGKTLEGIVTSWNEGAESIYGYSADEIIGLSISLLIPPDRPDEVQHILAKLKRGERIDHYETVRVSKSGSHLNISLSISPIKDTAGEIVGAATIARNITKRKQDEEGILRMGAVVEYSDDAIIGKTLEGIVTSWNKGAESIYGYSADEIIGKSISLLIPPDRPDEVPQILAKLKRGERTDHYETVRVSKSGSHLNISLSISPIKDTAGEIVGAATIARNITEFKRIQEKISQMANEIMELSTPVVQVWPGVVVAPIIGTLDTQRTQQIMERLLKHIVDTRSRVALLDITGVPTIDTANAQHLIDTVKAVKLLGSHVVITGVRPSIAQTLVHLGIDLSDIICRSSLADGLHIAFEMQGLKVIDGSKGEGDARE